MVQVLLAGPEPEQQFATKTYLKINRSRPRARRKTDSKTEYTR